jgi:hypothetical protein
MAPGIHHWELEKETLEQEQRNKKKFRHLLSLSPTAVAVFDELFAISPKYRNFNLFEFSTWD